MDFNINTYWNVNVVIATADYCVVDYQARVMKDTLINQIKYHKIHQYTTAEYIASTNPSACILKNYVHYVREDTANKKVYMKWDVQSSEQEILDFNLNLNDTIKHNNGISTLTVDSIAYTNINGIQRKIYYSSDPFIQLIEGVGFTSGFPQWFGSISTLSGTSQLLCMQNSNQLIYPDSNSILSCPFQSPLDIQNFEVQASMYIHPNPFQNFIRLENKVGLKNYLVYDISGRTVQQGKLQPGYNHIELNLPEGIYIFQTENEDGVRYGSKLVRN